MVAVVRKVWGDVAADRVAKTVSKAFAEGNREAFIARTQAALNATWARKRKATPTVHRITDEDRQDHNQVARRIWSSMKNRVAYNKDGTEEVGMLDARGEPSFAKAPDTNPVNGHEVSTSGERSHLTKFGDVWTRFNDFVWKAKKRGKDGKPAVDEWR